MKKVLLYLGFTTFLFTLEGMIGKPINPLITKLMNAIAQGDSKAILEALHDGADPDQMEDEFPLLYALEIDNTKAMKILLEAGANANLVHLGTLDSLLNTAIQYANKEAIQLLLQYGADPMLEDRNQRRPALYAVHLWIKQPEGENKDKLREIVDILYAAIPRESKW